MTPRDLSAKQAAPIRGSPEDIPHERQRQRTRQCLRPRLSMLVRFFLGTLKNNSTAQADVPIVDHHGLTCGNRALVVF